MDNVTVKVGDYGYSLNFTVLSAAGEPVTLTGYAIMFKVWAEGTVESPLLEGACEIILATAGTCRYTVQDGDFDTAGAYLYELELTTDASVESTDTGNLTVKESPVTEAVP